MGFVSAGRGGESSVPWYPGVALEGSMSPSSKVIYRERSCGLLIIAGG